MQFTRRPSRIQEKKRTYDRRIHRWWQTKRIFNYTRDSIRPSSVYACATYAFRFRRRKRTNSTEVKSVTEGISIFSCTTTTTVYANITKESATKSLNTVWHTLCVRVCVYKYVLHCYCYVIVKLSRLNSCCLFIARSARRLFCDSNQFASRVFTAPQ